MIEQTRCTKKRASCSSLCCLRMHFGRNVSRRDIVDITLFLVPALRTDMTHLVDLKITYIGAGLQYRTSQSALLLSRHFPAAHTPLCRGTWLRRRLRICSWRRRRWPLRMKPARKLLRHSKPVIGAGIRTESFKPPTL